MSKARTLYHIVSLSFLASPGSRVALPGTGHWCFTSLTWQATGCNGAAPLAKEKWPRQHREARRSEFGSHERGVNRSCKSIRPSSTSEDEDLITTALSHLMVAIPFRIMNI
eukprot:s93_g21.t1